MKGFVLSVEREIAAPPEAIFDVLSDASKHALIDGSGMLQGVAATSAVTDRLALGSTFGMGMKMVASATRRSTPWSSSSRTVASPGRPGPRGTGAG